MFSHHVGAAGGALGGWHELGLALPPNAVAPQSLADILKEGGGEYKESISHQAVQLECFFFFFFPRALQISKVGPIGISQQLQTKTALMERTAQWDNAAPPESCSNTPMKTCWNRHVLSNCVLAGRQFLSSRVSLKYLRFGSYGNVTERRRVRLRRRLNRIFLTTRCRR